MTLFDKLTRTKAKSVLGIDASTKSIAFAKFVDGKLKAYGTVELSGAESLDRVIEAKRKAKVVNKLVGPVDYLCIESVVKVNSVQVAIKMAYAIGAMIAEFQDSGAKVVTSAPIQWQSYIGNKNWTKAQREALAIELPGKSKTWYSGEIRRRRKAYTLDYFNDKYGISVTDDNVGDAIGLGWYASEVLTR